MKVSSKAKALYLYEQLLTEEDPSAMAMPPQDVAGGGPAAPEGEAEMAPPGGDMGADDALPMDAAPQVPPGMVPLYVPIEALQQAMGGNMYDGGVGNDVNSNLTGAPPQVTGGVGPGAGNGVQGIGAMPQNAEEQQVIEAFRAWKKNKINEKAKNLYKQINEAYDEDSLVDEENEMFGSSTCPSCGKPLGMKDKVCKHCGKDSHDYVRPAAAVATSTNLVSEKAKSLKETV